MTSAEGGKKGSEKNPANMDRWQHGRRNTRPSRFGAPRGIRDGFVFPLLRNSRNRKKALRLSVDHLE
jgi:hypothetical protein